MLSNQLVGSLVELVSAFALLAIGIKSLQRGVQVLGGDYVFSRFKINSESRFSETINGLKMGLGLWSSSIVSQVLLGLVQAGLVKLSRSYLIMVGASIGAAISFSFLSLVSPHFYGVFLTLGLVSIFFPKVSFKGPGQSFFGVGLVLLGLKLFSYTLYNDQYLLKFIYDIFFYRSAIGLFVSGIISGLLLTLAFRSSMATFAILLSLAVTPFVRFDFLFGFLTGLNGAKGIFTFYHGKKGNVYAKRAALYYLLMGICSAIFGIVLYVVYVNFLRDLSYFYNFMSITLELSDKAKILVAQKKFYLGGLHFFMSLFSSIIFFLFGKKIIKFSNRFFPDSYHGDGHKLSRVGDVTALIPSLSVLQVEMHIEKFFNIIYRMFLRTGEYLTATSVDARNLAKIKDYERITDNILEEATEYFENIIEHSLTADHSKRLNTLIKVATELETVGDYLDKVATFFTKIDIAEEVTSKKIQLIKEYFALIHSNFLDLHTCIKEGRYNFSSDDRFSKLKGLKDRSYQIQKNILEDDEIDSDQKMSLISLVHSLRKISSHTFSLSRELARIKFQFFGNVLD